MRGTAKRLTCLADWQFGAAGNAPDCPGEGWSHPEAGFAWTTGPQSTVRIPCADWSSEPGKYVLELRLNPFTAGARLPAQTLLIRANGCPVAHDRLGRSCTVAYTLPETVLREAGQSGWLTLEVLHPDFARPSDLGLGEDSRPLAVMMHTLRIFRLPARAPADVTGFPPLNLPVPLNELGNAIERVCKLPIADFLRHFESLGHNCEFGLVQRGMGASKLGLFTFAGIDPENLLTGLRQDFAGIGQDVTVKQVETGPGGGDYMVHDERYHIDIHALADPRLVTAEEIHKRHRMRMARLHEHFLGQLDDAACIFVFQRPPVILPAEARALHVQLQRRGSNALLFVDEDPDLPAGAVVRLDHDLFHGKLDHLVPLDPAVGADLPTWMSLCINAYRLWTIGRAAHAQTG